MSSWRHHRQNRAKCALFTLRSLLFLVGIWLGYFIMPIRIAQVGTETEESDQVIVHVHPRVFCWIATMPNRHDIAVAVLETWGRHCDGIRFGSSELDDRLPIMQMREVPEGRDYLWLKTQTAFRHMHDEFLNEFEWFVKADDDTFFFIQNLRDFLRKHNSSDPLAFGQLLENSHNFYPSGGAGYVLSREAVKRVIEGFDNDYACADSQSPEDMMMGKCLGEVDVELRDATNERGEYTMSAMNMFSLLNGSTTSWHQEHSLRKPKLGLACCSPDFISMHGPKEADAYSTYYLMNLVKVYGK